jgi:hypothetical protein
LPRNATGISSVFKYHPFRFIDVKAQAEIQKQVVQHSAVSTTEQKSRFYMDFDFMCASDSDFNQVDKSKDCVILSYDGFSLYLMIVNKDSHFIWIFLITSKEPLINIVSVFLRQHSLKDGGCIRMDQGGELACSKTFSDVVLHDVHYTVKPTRSDSPSQNGSVKIYNNKFGIRTRALLYGSGLLLKFWSTALLHLVFLHNTS